MELRKKMKIENRGTRGNYNKSKSNPNRRIQTVVGSYVEVINKRRKKGRPTGNLVRRLVEILRDYDG